MIFTVNQLSVLIRTCADGKSNLRYNTTIIQYGSESTFCCFVFYSEKQMNFALNFPRSSLKNNIVLIFKKIYDIDEEEYSFRLINTFALIAD